MCNCKKFDSCSAPLCPKQPLSLATCSWFPGEEICSLAEFSALPWIKSQRRIARKGLGFDAGCFSVDMLEHPFILTIGTRGLDPDRDPPGEKAVIKWIKSHPARVKREMSEEERKQCAERLARGKKTLGKKSDLSMV